MNQTAPRHRQGHQKAHPRLTGGFDQKQTAPRQQSPLRRDDLRQAGLQLIVPPNRNVDSLEESVDLLGVRRLVQEAPCNAPDDSGQHGQARDQFPRPAKNVARHKESRNRQTRTAEDTPRRHPPPHHPHRHGDPDQAQDIQIIQDGLDYTPSHQDRHDDGNDGDNHTRPPRDPDELVIRHFGPQKRPVDILRDQPAQRDLHGIPRGHGSGHHTGQHNSLQHR